MPKTRNQIINGFFNTEEWPLSYDLLMMHSVHENCIHMETLDTVEVFNGVLHRATEELCDYISDEITFEYVKLRVHTIRKRFYAFLKYISKPGVKFDPCTKKVAVDMVTFSKENKETWEERWFRVNGFPVYDTCVIIFHIKNAAPIDFTGMTGYSENEPLVIEDGEDSEGSEKGVGEAVDGKEHVNENMEGISGHDGKEPGHGKMEGISGQVGEDVGKPGEEVVAETKDMLD
ncbi:hypothetical protein ACP275_06G127400 [Erythranthe tilingii]